MYFALLIWKFAVITIVQTELRMIQLGLVVYPPDDERHNNDPENEQFDNAQEGMFNSKEYHVQLNTFAGS
jgi:hypothetical protein